jgi:hypothetical protein
MTSLRQIEANRRNALRSTGPKTEEGKKRSRRNAIRHGLTAETVIEVLEDPEDYKAFELSVTSDFDAPTGVERELVLRLASLLWRLRRAISVETGLMQIQSEILREVRQISSSEPQVESAQSAEIFNAEIARCFLRLANLDNGAFDRLSRYETALWRQVGQLLFTINSYQRDRNQQRHAHPALRSQEHY